MLITVIINCFNGADFLGRAIESVLSQSYEKFELVIFDNCSDDESMSIAQGFLDDRILLISAESDHVLPLYQARNEALCYVRGEVFCFLDCDDLMLPDRLELIAKTFVDDKIDWMCTAYLKYVEERGEFSLHRQMNCDGEIRSCDLIDRYNIGILTCCYRTQIYEVVRFNSRFSIIGDFIFNVACASMFRGRYIDSPTAIYVEHGKNLSLTRKKLWAEELRKVFKLSVAIQDSSLLGVHWAVGLGRRSKVLCNYLEAVNPENSSWTVIQSFFGLCLHSFTLLPRAIVVRFLPFKASVFIKSYLKG